MILALIGFVGGVLATAGGLAAFVYWNLTRKY